MAKKSNTKTAVIYEAAQSAKGHLVLCEEGRIVLGEATQKELEYVFNNVEGGKMWIRVSRK